MWKFSEISFLYVLIIIIGTTLVNGEPKVPCYFIFGDSLSDAGTNNELTTEAKADYLPYGVDFPGRIPTGRFTNGRTIADFITQFLGFSSFIPPYSSQMGQDLLKGVNYASGASGILEESGSQLGDRLSMDRQLQNYKNSILQLQSMVQGPVSDLLNKCLYTVNTGSNDYINNYLVPQFFNTSKLYTPDQYASLLIARYRSQLQTLYDSGARKIAVFGLGQIGCIPAEMIRYNSTRCVKKINQAVDLFNKNLVSLVDDFNANLRSAKFTFINLSAMQNLSPFGPLGFLTDSTCCKLRSDFMCEANSPPCKHRDLHPFMDGFHPSEVMNKLAATTAYNTPLPLSLVHPMSIRQLINSKLASI